MIGLDWTLHQEVVDQLVHTMASGDPSFCDLPDREASSVLLPASDSRIAGTDALLQPWDDLQVYAFPPIVVIRKVLVN